MNVKQTIIHFLSTSITFDSAKQYLISIRNDPIQGHNLKESRMLWFSLLMYKFRQEQNTPDELWDDARSFILNVLRDQPYEESARKFIIHFSEWKETDFTTFTNEIVKYYLQVLHLKETIEETLLVSIPINKCKYLDVSYLFTILFKAIAHETKV